jgi:hypothetical protein
MKKGQCERNEFELSSLEVQRVKQKKLVEQLQILVKTYNNALDR